MLIDESHAPRKCVRVDREVNAHKNRSVKSEEKCRTRAALCRFCDGAINDAVRTLFSPPICYKSFCKDAEHLHGLWNKWRLLESSPNINERITSPVKTHLQSIQSRDSSTKSDFNDIKNEHKDEFDVNFEKRYGHGYGNKSHDGYKNENIKGYKESKKSRIGVPEKRDAFNLNEIGEKGKMEKKRFKGKEENSRGRLDGSRGQERPGKMIHDRADKKISSLWHRGGSEIKSEEMTLPPRRRRRSRSGRSRTRRETEEARQPGGRGKKGDALDRLSGRAYRHGDEEKKFLKSREKRKDAGARNENKMETRDLLSGKKYRTGYTEASCSTEETNETIFELGTEKSTLNLELGSSTGGNGTMRTRSKGSKFAESSLTTGEDFARTNDSRYRNIKSNATPCQNEIGSPNTIEYQLSNEYFGNLGWTIFPVRKIVRKMFIYEARLAKPHLNWFQKYRYEGRKYYEDGLTPFLTFHPDATGEVFYPHGRIAVRVDRPKNREYDMYTVFTPGGKDVLGVVREPQLIAAFDTLGNGIILDENGATRLSYNQIGGIWRDNPGGLPFQWSWSSNVGEPIIENVYLEKSTSGLEKLLPPMRKNLGSTETTKTPSASVRAGTREKAAIVGEMEQKPVVDAVVVVGEREEDLESEFNAVRENRSSIDRDNNAVKIICLRLNEYLSFRILDRRNVNLQFFAGNKSIRIELGTVLNSNKKLSSYYSDAADWRSDAHRCRFKECCRTKLQPESSLYDFSQEFQRIRKYAKQREAMMAKYNPLFKKK